MARTRARRWSKPPPVPGVDLSNRGEPHSLVALPSDSSASPNPTVPNRMSSSDDNLGQVDRMKAVRMRRRCELCSRFIPAVGPPRCARCATAEAAQAQDSTAPTIAEQLTINEIATREQAVRAVPPAPQPRLPDVPIPARSWPPGRPVTPRQVPLPAPLEGRLGAANDFVIPRPSQLHPPVPTAMPSGVLLPHVRPATVQVSPPRRSWTRYALAISMIAIGLAIGLLIPFAGQFVRI